MFYFIGVRLERQIDDDVGVNFKKMIGEINKVAKKYGYSVDKWSDYEKFKRDCARAHKRDEEYSLYGWGTR